MSRDLDVARAAGLSRRSLLKQAAGAGLTLSAAGLLEACGSSGGGASSTTSGPVTGDIEFIKGPWNDADLPVLRKVTSRDFESANRGIDVKDTVYDWGTFETQLTTRFASSNPPDVIYLGAADAAKFGEQGALADLTPFLDSGEFVPERTHMFRKQLDLSTFQGKAYAVPWASGVYPIVVNLDLVEQAGVTDWNTSYDKLRAAAKAMTKGDVYGFGMATTYKDYSYQDWLPYVFAAGSNLFNADDTGGGLGTPEVADAWDLLHAIYQDGSAPPPGQYDFEGMRGLFAAGRVGILHEQVDFIAVLKQKRVPFKYDIFEPPPGPHPASLMLDMGCLSIAQRSAHKDAAWRYVEFLLSKQGYRDYIARLDIGGLPARDDVSLANGNRFYRKAESFLPNATPLPMHPKVLDGLRLASDQFQLCVSGKKTGAQAAQDANAALDRLLAA